MAREFTLLEGSQNALRCLTALKDTTTPPMTSVSVSTG